MRLFPRLHRMPGSTRFGLNALTLTRASAAALSTASASAASATATKAGIWFRIDDQPVEEQIDRVRHNLDGIECVVIECVRGALDGCNRCRHAGGVQLREELDA